MRRGARYAAKQAGLSRYSNGKPCLYGHVAERFTSTCACCECAALAKKDWAARNIKTVLATNARWLANNRERALAGKRERYRKNPAKFFAQVKKRKMSQRMRTPKWADFKAIEAIYCEAQRQRETGLDVVVDHDIPLCGERVSGLHVHENLRIIGARANKVKANTFQI